MHAPLRQLLFLLASAPFLLHAQLIAGDPSGAIHTPVAAELVPVPIEPPYMRVDSIAVDLQGDGVDDLRFSAREMIVPDAVSDWNALQLLHASVDVAVIGAGSSVMARLHAGDLVDADLHWLAFGDFSHHAATLASRSSSFGHAYTLGAEGWWANGAVATEGYIGVRLVQDGHVRYGWVGLTSQVEVGSARLLVHDLAIQDASVTVSPVDGLGAVTVHTRSDGLLVLHGPLQQVRHYLVHDMSGRTVLQGSAPLRSTIDLAGEPSGLYVLTLVGGSVHRSIKLVR